MRTEIAADEVALRHVPAARMARPEAFHIRPLDAQRDAPTLHRWFIEERAAFWNMRDKSVADVAAFYQAIEDSEHARAWLGLRDDVPAFLFERLGAQRVVVEPDARNARIHALNRAMGFAYTKDVAFREKTASLAFCTRADFYAAVTQDH